MKKIAPGIFAHPDDAEFLCAGTLSLLRMAGWDHEITSRIVQTACFSTGTKDMKVNSEPFVPIPFLYYCDAMEERIDSEK